MTLWVNAERERRRQRPWEYEDDFTAEDWGEAFDGFPERKRQRIAPSDTDESSDSDPSGSPVPMMPDLKTEYTEVRRGNPGAFVFAWRWTYCAAHGLTKEQFIDVKTAAFIKEGLAKLFPKSKFIYQLEDSTRRGDNYHYQGFINLAKRSRMGALVNAINTPIMMPGCQIQYASANGKAALQAYVMKADTRVAGPWWDKPGDPPIPYDGEDLPKEWWPWQKQVIDVVMGTKPDDRTINWVVDTAGKQGKSKVSKYLMWKGVARTFGWVEAKNAYYSIAQEGGQRAYIFDLTRTKPKKQAMDDLYSMLEAIKNGMVDGSLYENKSVLFMPPHVWVFANMPPKVDALSRDRFVTWTIDAERRLRSPTNARSAPLEASAKGHQQRPLGVISSATTPASRVSVVPDEDETYD